MVIKMNKNGKIKNIIIRIAKEFQPRYVVIYVRAEAY